MKVDIKELIGSLQAIHSPSARVGLPDGPCPVDIPNLPRLSRCLDNALHALRDLRGGSSYLVCAEVETSGRVVRIRFVQGVPEQESKVDVDTMLFFEPALRPAFQSLSAALRRSRGELDYWGGENYFDVLIPCHGSMRENFPNVEHLPWDERYRYLLQQESWDSLRNRVFRFGYLAESFANRCVEFGLSRVVVPSVGLCVHPWLFADHGLLVIATDVSESALAALSEPDSWPQLYSRAAFERWDISMSASYAGENGDGFKRMPDLQDGSVRALLRQRITFAHSDWTNLPLASGSVDAIFATNALPRESCAEQTSVLKEWTRVVRPGGLAFIAQHNFLSSDVDQMLLNEGWMMTDILRGERPTQSGKTGFQTYYSSG